MTPEEEQFASAFYAVHGRGEVPTARAILLEMEERGGRQYRIEQNLSGRLTALRTELLEKEGYVKIGGRWQANTAIPGETESTGAWWED